ncbi:MAG: hypothetical protein KAT48_10170 [Bacteroidales bacterium]|nr:hypothetical protein [Bacteroidales bacterium]
MAITMQGNWFVQVKAKHAAYQQKFVISGASTGNGTYNGTVGNTANVTGNNWTINIIHKPTGGAFTPSDMRIKFPLKSGILYQFDIESNDTGNDTDFNDLILTCKTPVTVNDYIVYGKVKYYDEYCMFNPCYKYAVVIDNYISFLEAIKSKTIYEAVKLLYPSRLPKKRVHFLPEEPDPVPFIPMVIPLSGHAGIPERKNVMVKSRVEKIPLKKLIKDAESSEIIKYNAPVSISEVAMESHSINDKFKALDRVALGSIKDRYKIICDSGVLPHAILRYQEYDRTSAELAGGPYTGLGYRENLGTFAADMNGNYIFRFHRTFEQILEETEDTPAGESTVVHSQPDIIARLAEQDDINNILFETSPFWNIPYLKRIDLCVPKSKANLVPFVCKDHGHLIQSIGDIEVGQLNTSGERVGFNNYLTSNGIVSAYNSIAPKVKCASWIGRLDLTGCLSNSAIKYYTVRYKRPWQFTWNPIEDTLTASRYAGSFTVTENIETIRDLKIDGSPVGIPTKAFLNIENSTVAWTELSKITKARIHTSRYDNGEIQIRIEGFKNNGDKVAGADEVITLFFDNVVLHRHNDIDIDEYVTMDGIELGNCALFTLPVITTDPLTLNEGAPITVRVKVNHSSGFMENYSVYMHKGAIGGFGLNPDIEDAVFPTTGPLMNSLANRGRKYVHADNLVCCLKFKGTDNEPGLCSDGYYEMILTPKSGKWLEPDEAYCSFGIYLHATLRHTNGKHGYPTPTHATPVLIGIQRP